VHPPLSRALFGSSESFLLVTTTRGWWLFDVFSMTIVHNVIILSIL